MHRDDGLTALPGAARASRDFAEGRDPIHRRCANAAQAPASRRLRRHRAVERLCRFPRLVAELLDEIARHNGIADDVEQRIAAYAAADPEILAALGGDRFPASLLRVIGGRQ